ncbi:hypothetical protein, partial [Adlercreutzia equolifaciens]|uniref:hypothetical protein n=1 Tax=Adlercreutzia equolifaciens TaxID=446660 RepID=UPI003AF84B59
ASLTLLNADFAQKRAVRLRWLQGDRNAVVVSAFRDRNDRKTTETTAKRPQTTDNGRDIKC